MSDSPLVLLQWQGSHLDLFPQKTWDEIEKNLLKHRRAEGDGGAYLRHITSSAINVEPDNHGRIRIPAWLKEKADLEDTVLFVGVLDRIELWNPARFEEDLREPDPEADRFAAQIFS